MDYSFGCCSVLSHEFLVLMFNQHVLYSNFLLLMDALMVYHTVAVLNLCIQFEIQCPAEEEVTPKKKMCFFFLFVITSFF